MKTEEAIDAVITWVNGDEPAHRRKMEPYLENIGRTSENTPVSTRFRTVGEIFFCVASILRFAQFVKTIFIVTDQQDPQLDDFMKDNFPDNKIPVVIVDHTVIFRGYEQYLPTFNSLSIESCLFRIPSLSENFIYFNDDFFLARPTCPEDWFIDNKAIARGCWGNYAATAFLSLIKPRKNGRKPFGFKDSMLNAAKALRQNKRFFFIRHTPHPLKKSVFEKFYGYNPELFIANISHRFRNDLQHNPQSLFYMLGLQSGECIARSEFELYMKPVGRNKGYVDRKMRNFRKRSYKFVCIQSLDMAAGEDRRALGEWLKELLNITINII